MLLSLRCLPSSTLVVLLTFGSLLAPARASAQAAQGPGCVPGGIGPSVGPLAGLVQPASAPDELLALVEIPAGEAIKYELHRASGRMAVDRFLAMPMAYPASYGILPCTLADDGDELDVLILSRFPPAPGTVIRVRTVGVLRMVDRGEQDDKLLVVPVDAVDATWSSVREPADLPPSELGRIEAFFRVYKQLPEPAVAVEVGPWEGSEVAVQLVRAAMARAIEP
jgi:inorganic pyrophosphatase